MSHTFDQVLAKAMKLNPNLDVKRLRDAYSTSIEINKDKFRLNGDPYYEHWLQVVDILLDLRPDEATIIATFLNGVENRDDFDEEVIKNKFGKEVLFLVKSIAAVRHIRSRDVKSETENIRRMLLTMAQDIRVIFIKLAQAIRNIETLDVRAPQKQKAVAQETLDIFVPIASQLGLYSIKGRLEDNAFKFIKPEEYKMVKEDLDEYIKKRGHTIDDIKKILEKLAGDVGYNVRVEGRIKSLFSIYKKLKLKNATTLDEIYDIYAMRIILPDIKDDDGNPVYSHLYEVLGKIHDKWQPLPERFKDYVSISKPNGYQSLHTAVVGLSPDVKQPTEIQIRTKKMHEEAEYGLATHWLYEDGKKDLKHATKRRFSLKNLSTKAADEGRFYAWMDFFTQFQKQYHANKGITKSVPISAFSDRIFVLTPAGDVKDLPKGSTPVDFAYLIHTDLGNKCQFAKVNGQIVPLNYKLRNGETIEIGTHVNANPNPSWLSFVKTAGAKTKIKNYLRSLDKEYHFREGKEIVNKYLQKYGFPPLDDDLRLFKEYNNRKLSIKERVGLIEEIGNGSVMVTSVLRKILGSRLNERKAAGIKSSKKKILPAPKGGANQNEIFIAGASGLPYKIANCCQPKKGDPIVGYITRDHIVTIHSQKCKMLREARDERMLDAKWAGVEYSKVYPVKISLFARDRVGLIRDASDVISGMGVNFTSFENVKRNDGLVEWSMVLEVSSNEQIYELMNSLKRIRSVLEVRCPDSNYELKGKEKNVNSNVN
ncbi:RelA/SpoT family protein [Candidatus Peregrinibacteria bacterium]|nr:RelA/SpoT family protein [Candidatus Peregrinibacteria bacterium]